MKMSNTIKGSVIGMIIACVILAGASYVIGADTFKRGLGAGEYYKNAGLTQGGTDYQARSVYCDDYNWLRVIYDDTTPRAATYRMILVDLSDTTNFPHTLTNRVIFDQFRLLGVSTGSALWSYKLGVVIRTGATNGDIDWFGQYSSKSTVPNVGSGFVPTRPMNTLLSGSTPVYFATGNTTRDSADWDNDDAKDTVLGGNTMIAVGDIVFEMKEIDNGETVTIYDLWFDYRTQ